MGHLTKFEKNTAYHQIQPFHTHVQPVRRIYSPEEKCAMTKDLMSGKITMWQYDRIESLGYDGDDIRRWTKHRASQELEKIKATLEPTTEIMYDHALTVKLRRKQQRFNAYALDRLHPTPENRNAIGNDDGFYVQMSKAQKFDGMPLKAYGVPSYMNKREASKAAKAAGVSVVTVRVSPARVLAAGTINQVAVITLRGAVKE